MKGLLVHLYYSGEKPVNAPSKVIVVGLGADAEIFEANETMPAYKLIEFRGNKVLVPVEERPGVRTFGGAFASTSDARWCRAVPFYGAVPVHNRYEA